MLCRVLVGRMGCLQQDITSLYALAGDAELPLTVRLAAAGSLASFLSTTVQPLEKWLLDTLFLRMGLCLLMSALGKDTGEFADDLRLVKRSLSGAAVRRIESALGRLASSEFAGGAMSAVINDQGTLMRLYSQAVAKAAVVPLTASCDETLTRIKLELLLG
ncbi:MAG: hypothetical protein FD169_467 [Bacillota bacterium]|nr:MAG: hypothetical protein FD169_467 [Bacillota bacterium]